MLFDWGACIKIKTCCQSIFLLLAFLAPASVFAAELPPRSLLVLEQSDVRGPFYAAIFSGLRSEVTAKAASPVTIYVENLDLNRFTGSTYEQSLRNHLAIKYRDKPIGVIVAVGTNALDFALRWRGELWPGVPVVFALVDEATIARLELPGDVTGRITRLRLEDMVTVGGVVVHGLKRIAIVGDRLETQPIFREFRDQIPVVAAGLEVIDLTGLPMKELRKRVAALPDDAAILYTAIYSDGEGTYFPPADAVAMIAETANRPIVASLETFVGRGAIGGYVVIPSIIGQEAAALSLRLLNGESPNAIPIITGDALQPIFDWQQLQRWNVHTVDLPQGSEIRNRVLTIWEQYPREIAAIAGVFLLQSGLLIALFYEHRRRRKAEVETQQRLTELAHLNRHATAGELSASIAHELNQPLGAILSNTQTAERLLKSTSPDLDKIREILADVRRDDQRASNVIARLRSLIKKTEFVRQKVDLNDVVREVFAFVSVQAKANNVTLVSALSSHPLPVSGDPIQLQQVVLNLVVNGIEALSASEGGVRRITGRTHQLNDLVIDVAIADSGPGIPSERVAQVFEPFFTSKDNGMGMGLSIARTIVEAHGGRLWAENQPVAGAVFRINLPLAQMTSG